MTTSHSSTRRPWSRRSLLGTLAVAPAATVGGAWALTEAAGATGSDRSGAPRGGDSPVPPALRKGGEFDRYLSGLAAKDQFSGTVLVARGGHPVLSRSYGFTDRKTRVRNRADTIFCLASVTKLFTATAVAQLVARGKLAVTDTIGEHLSGFSAPVADKVTIHHLLTHTSGLGDFMQDKGYFDAAKTWTTPERMMDGTLEFIRKEQLAFEPGAGERYSNAGYHVLGCIVQQVSGQSYYQYVQRHVFGAAGMTDASFCTLPQWQSERRIAHPYPTDSSGKRHDALSTDAFVFIGDPAGNAFGTARDLVRFARALAAGSLLAAPYQEVFFTPKTALKPLPPPPGAPSMAEYGSYGAQLRLIDGRRWTAGHSGGAPGVYANVDWFPGTDWTAVVLSNYDAPRSPTAPTVDLKLRTILTAS
ncbi:serine hydrolase domain-containing protein [Actinocatenispora thailandica]|nr:serine hydrolase domain-containing protein [Actinocatenispora thailandica]